MPRAVLVSYATDAYRANQWRNAHSGRRVGGFHEVWRFGPRDLDAEFRRRNEAVLSAPLGAGTWLWKPYVVLRALERLAPGDVLLYSDAAAHFRASARPLVDLCLLGPDVVCFELPFPFLERAYTKRDAFVMLGCDEPAHAEARQRLAGMLLLRKTPGATDLAERWLDAARDPRLLTDTPNACGLPDYEGIVGHRHDQSLWSLLTRRAGYPAYRDPSQFGVRDTARHPESHYRQITSVTRRRPVPRRFRFLSAIGVPP